MQKIQQLMCSDLNHHMESAFLFTQLVTTNYLRQKEKESTDRGEANSKRYVWLLIF